MSSIIKDRCTVCQQVIDNNLTLLCDKEGCKNEVHTYCLETELFIVPEGNWFCPSCDDTGTFWGLVKYFVEHDKEKENLSLTYNEWLLHLKHNWTFSGWIASADNDTSTSTFNFQSEFKDVTNTEAIIGKVIYIYLPNDMQCHIGRIIGRRTNELGLIEHLIQFKW